jgi:protein O-mannosyl-transferase
MTATQSLDVPAADRRAIAVSTDAARDNGMRQWIYIALLMLAVLVAYTNSLSNEFTMDDRQLYVIKNPVVTHPSFHGFLTPHAVTKVFRPVTFAVFALEWRIGGGRPFIFHLGNLFLHIAVTLLLFALLQALLRTLANGAIVAFAAALLFAVHPIHTEAVTSIVGCAELLAAAFLFAAWIFHLKDREIPSLICFGLAVLSKESAIVFLPLALLGDYTLGRWKPPLRYVRIAVLSVLYLGILWKLDGGHFGPAEIQPLDNPLASLPVHWRVLDAIRVAWKYVALQLYPATLSCDYSFNEIPMYLDWRHTLPAALAAGMVLAGWVRALWKRQFVYALAGTMYFAGFAVTANIFAPIGTVMAERLAYVPSAGLCLMAAWAWQWLYRRQRLLASSALILVLGGLGIRTILRNRDWKDNLTLWSADARAVPNSAKIHLMLGSAYVDTGQFDPALKEMELALKIDPQFTEALEAGGLLQLSKGNYQAAGQMLEQAFYTVHRGYPNYDGIAVNLAVLYMQTGHLEGALQLLDREIAEAPGYARAWAVRGLVHHQRGETSAARSDAETALRLDPTNSDARSLLQLLGKPGEPREGHGRP